MGLIAGTVWVILQGLLGLTGGSVSLNGGDC